LTKLETLEPPPQFTAAYNRLKSQVSNVNADLRKATLTGTPAPGSAGVYPITIAARNGVGVPAVQSFTLNVVTFSVTGVTPGTIAQGADGVAVKLTGSGFRPGATVTAADPGITFSSVSVRNATTISAHEGAAGTVAPGSYDLTVSESGVSTSCSGCLTVPPAPAISSLSLTTLAQGALSVPVTIDGSGFTAPATVSIAGPGTGIGAVVSSATATAVTARVTVPANAAPGNYTLSVRGANGGVATCADCLTIHQGPSITAISPAAAAPGQKIAVTITGTGFSQDAKLTAPKGVAFSGVTVAGDRTSINATMTVSSTAAAGSALPVTVTNGPLGDYGRVSDPALTIT